MSGSSLDGRDSLGVLADPHRALPVPAGRLGESESPVLSARADHPPLRRRRPLVLKLAAFVAAAALVVVLLRAFVVEPYSVPGTGMAPTIGAGDRILVRKAGLLGGAVGRGDVVVFHAPQAMPCSVVGGSGPDLVLRVVALPGEVIRSVGDTILVDGKPLRGGAWYDHRFGQVGSTPISRTAVGPGQYFVLADNRSEACDSRRFGPIAQDSIVGEGIAVVGRHGHVSLGTL